MSRKKRIMGRGWKKLKKMPIIAILIKLYPIFTETVTWSKKFIGPMELLTWNIVRCTYSRLCYKTKVWICWPVLLMVRWENDGTNHTTWWGQTYTERSQVDRQMCKQPHRLRATGHKTWRFAATMPITSTQSRCCLRSGEGSCRFDFGTVAWVDRSSGIAVDHNHNNKIGA